MCLHEICDREDDPKNQIWETRADYNCELSNVTASKFHEVRSLLLERPNLNSSHLFRADILYDSLGLLKTVFEKESALNIKSSRSSVTTVPPNIRITSNSIYADSAIDTVADTTTTDIDAPCFDGFKLEQTVIRRLIPRNPQSYKSLEQSCFIYTDTSKLKAHLKYLSQHLVVYVSHVSSEQDMPWYHPPIQALAYLFKEGRQFDTTTPSTFSIYYKLFAKKPTADDHNSENGSQSTRFHRTFLSLLRTFIRLTKLETPLNSIPSTITSNGVKPRVTSRSVKPSALKDTILPQHIVQDTYVRLKQKYAAELMSKWVEKTEPSKHIFEDLSIAAFLIELWKQMYVDNPFPGFVDFACGNGVLVYVLIREGFHGYGYDARKRKTWSVLGIDGCLEERICIPQPLLARLQEDSASLDLVIHNGIFKPGTFIISNHADELTPWTPILAVLANMVDPLPFLAIPCCSHALSGARYRYKVKEIDNETLSSSPASPTTTNFVKGANEDIQGSHGDLRALRAQKLQAANHGIEQSQYACLTKKVVALAEEVGHDVEMTLIRIPSTRNIGIVGNRRNIVSKTITRNEDANIEKVRVSSSSMEILQALLERECRRDGGIGPAAHIWYERARKLQEGGGRGKVNLGVNPQSSTAGMTSTTA